MRYDTSDWPQIRRERCFLGSTPPRFLNNRGANTFVSWGQTTSAPRRSTRLIATYHECKRREVTSRQTKQLQQGTLSSSLPRRPSSARGRKRPGLTQMPHRPFMPFTSEHLENFRATERWGDVKQPYAEQYNMRFSTEVPLERRRCTLFYRGPSNMLVCFCKGSHQHTAKHPGRRSRHSPMGRHARRRICLHH